MRFKRFRQPFQTPLGFGFAHGTQLPGDFRPGDPPLENGHLHAANSRAIAADKNPRLCRFEPRVQDGPPASQLRITDVLAFGHMAEMRGGSKAKIQTEDIRLYPLFRSSLRLPQVGCSGVDNLLKHLAPPRFFDNRTVIDTASVLLDDGHILKTFAKNPWSTPEFPGPAGNLGKSRCFDKRGDLSPILHQLRRRVIEQGARSRDHDDSFWNNPLSLKESLGGAESHDTGERPPWECYGSFIGSFREQQPFGLKDRVLWIVKGDGIFSENPPGNGSVQELNLT